LKTFYVVHQPKDTHNIHNLIRDKLTKDGFTATAGPELPQSSYQADSIITYVDRWMWDITLYLLELTVTLRDKSNDFPLAVGNSFHTSLTRKSPEEMVDEVMTNIFNAAKKTPPNRALMNFGEIRKNLALSLLGLWFFLSALVACATLG